MRIKEDTIRCRVLEEAHYFIDNRSTIRATAKVFGLSKSTIFRDLTKNLPYYSQSLYLQVCFILSKNKEERSLRGGLATAKKHNSQKI